MTSKTLDSFIKTVKELAVVRDLTNAQIADSMGISRQQVSNLLSGKSYPNLESLVRLAKALEVPVFYLLMTDMERARWETFNQMAAGFASSLKKKP